MNIPLIDVAACATAVSGRFPLSELGRHQEYSLDVTGILRREVRSATREPFGVASTRPRIPRRRNIYLKNFVDIANP
jgi:hypothetical protein